MTLIPDASASHGPRSCSRRRDHVLLDVLLHRTQSLTSHFTDRTSRARRRRRALPMRPRRPAQRTTTHGPERDADPRGSRQRDRAAAAVLQPRALPPHARPADERHGPVPGLGRRRGGAAHRVLDARRRLDGLGRAARVRVRVALADGHLQRGEPEAHAPQHVARRPVRSQGNDGASLLFTHDRVVFLLLRCNRGGR